MFSALAMQSTAAPGNVDLSFDTGSGVNSPVYALVVQPDGKAIIGGSFKMVKGLARHGIARLNVDGSGDPTFSPGAPLTSPATIYALALQSDKVWNSRRTRIFHF